MHIHTYIHTYLSKIQDKTKRKDKKIKSKTFLCRNYIYINTYIHTRTVHNNIKTSSKKNLYIIYKNKC